ncbi:Protein shisa-9A [Oryzias melastigma]|uniref:Protein shisa-9A n=1 Tax=Oryzias melastigma TaxID=30732 RepID=A0A3B3BMV7_ORYME|nr:protein shisa-9A [Oryzias melastigma]KAF6733746.1 Protein shisa-9A [Oryzias melastigma]
MTGKDFLLGFLLLKLMALVCKADGEPGLLGGFVMIATSNGSREESVSEETPHTEDNCRGYYDVMGQWDPPFICKTGNYLYCCGTCGFRFCCSFKQSRLDQSTCKNYDTPLWMKTGQPPYKKMKKIRENTKDKTNLIVYIICGVVAIMALVGIFTKLGLEKAHRPQRENMSRAVASVLQGGCPGEQYRGEEALGMHSQHFVSRAANIQGGQINNNVAAGASVGQQHPYPALSQLAHVYEQQQQQQNKDLNKYASLKAVAAKYNGELYNKRRLMVELPSKGGLPLQPMGNSRPSMGNMSSMTPPMTNNPMTSNPMSSNAMNPTITQMTSMAPMTSMTPMTSLTPMTSMTPMTSLGPLTPEPVATYVTEMPSISAVSTLPTERHIAGGVGGGHKPNGQKPKVGHGHVGHSSHSHAHSHSNKHTGLGAASLAHLSGTMPGGTSLGISRAAETAFGSNSATMGRPMAYSSNTIAAGHSAGFGLRGWDGTETVGRRKSYGHKRPQCTVLEPNQLHTSRGHSHSQHFLPTQPYFVTNSKTEVTV